MSDDDRHEKSDPVPELLRLVDLAVKYPEIGPPLAQLAFKIGQGEIGDRIVKMGLESDAHGVEYWFVKANAARRDGRHGDVLETVVDAVRAFIANGNRDEGGRLLQLVRLGWTTLLFDVKDIHAAPEFVKALGEELPKLEGVLGADPGFHAAWAQTLWFENKNRSELAWEQAAELGEPELTWNARGTWYKEAEQDDEKAENAYRKGLEAAPQSALLRHNLAQLHVDRASREGVDPGTARKLLAQADELIRAALRDEASKGLRRHIHHTRDRLISLRQSLPQPERRRRDHLGQHAQHGDAGAEHRDDVAPAPPPPPPAPPPEVGATLKGRVQSLQVYGAFVHLETGHVGLLHKSEIAHERVDDPARFLNVGDEVEVKVIDVQPNEGGGRMRIGLSRRALLEAPARPQQQRPQQHRDRDRDRDDRGGGGGGPRRDPRPAPPRQPVLDEKTAKLAKGKLTSLGDLLAAKLKGQVPEK